MQRPNEREFLQQVLGEIDDLPAGLTERFLEILEDTAVDRADALRKLFEECTRE